MGISCHFQFSFFSRIHLEAKYGWTGLLIEPNEEAFQKMKSIKRNALAINACASVRIFAYAAQIDRPSTAPIFADHSNKLQIAFFDSASSKA